LLEDGEQGKAGAQFLTLYATARKNGRLPAINKDFRRALSAEDWAQLITRTADDYLVHDQRGAVLRLAQQCDHLGDSAAAENLVRKLTERPGDSLQFALALVSVDWLAQAQGAEKALTLLEPLLNDKRFGDNATLWRLAARLAVQGRQATRSFTCLERALDLEYRPLPDVLDLQAVRQDYGSLLAHFEARAGALATLEQPPPRDLVVRVVRAADRWRSLDVDGTAACQAAARILSSLGAPELAWDYLTTSYTADQTTNWLAVAQGLQQSGDIALAERAYAAALEADSGNALIVWAHADMLRQAGRPAEARPLLRRLVQGQWAAQYKQIRDQARQVLESQAALGY
jgi:predicted Zn-dependent protease